MCGIFRSVVVSKYRRVVCFLPRILSGFGLIFGLLGSISIKNAFFLHFSLPSDIMCRGVGSNFAPDFNKTRTIMDNSIKSLVLDTISIVGMFFVAALLLCV